jgi:hypothetical protein
MMGGRMNFRCDGSCEEVGQTGVLVRLRPCPLAGAGFRRDA